MPEPITDIPLAQMPAVVKELGLKPYSALQLISWLYKRRVLSFDAMTNLSKATREVLAKKFVIDAVTLERALEAKDATRKYLCRTHDGTPIECVFIPAEDGRYTVCVSTQVGCAMGCSFCRTAKMGFVRNLTQGEVLGQLIIIMRDRPEHITNVVLMGMGEPLANLDVVSNAVQVITDSRAFGFSKRRVTLSTCGLLTQLQEFTRRFDIKIAISLNATTDEIRSKLMPINKQYPIARIMDFCRTYSEKSRHRFTFEYVLIRDINDTLDDVKRLVAILRGIRAKVNLIPFNPYPGSEFRSPLKATIEMWSDWLHKAGIQANIRESRGQDIMAACGQLAAHSTAMEIGNPSQAASSYFTS